MQKIKISPTYLAPIFIRRECYAAPCRINYTSHSRTRYRVTTAHNPPPPDSTRLCIRSKTTHMNNSTAQCRHDNFTHHTPHKTLQTTAHRLHQTPRPHTIREPNMTIRRTTHAPLKCSTHAPRHHTPKQTLLKANTHKRTARPESQLAHHARHTHHNLFDPHPHGPPVSVSEASSAPDPQAWPDPLYRAGLPLARRPVQSSGRALGLRGSSHSRSRHLHRLLGARQARLWRRRNRKQLTAACGAPSLRGREVGGDGFRQCWATGGVCAGAVRTSRAPLGNLRRFDVPGTYVQYNKTSPLALHPIGGKTEICT